MGGRVGGRSSRVCVAALARGDRSADTAGAITAIAGMATNAVAVQPMQ